MVRDRFVVTPSACGWQVIHQAEPHGPYTTHCEAALAAMLLAQIASEGGMYAEVVIEDEVRHIAPSADPHTLAPVRHLATFGPLTE